MRALTLWCAATLFGGLIFGCAGVSVKTETVSTPKPAGLTVVIHRESDVPLYVCGFLTEDDFNRKVLTCDAAELYKEQMQEFGCHEL